MNFELNENQKLKVRYWQNEHLCSKELILQDRFIYSFIPTEFGVLSECKCICGQKIDLTEY